MSEPAARARGLVKRFGAVTALRGVDLDIPAGAIAAVLGPNGAGKTTLLRILAGLGRASEGTLQIDGQERRGAETRARVGFVGHATLLYPELSARENLLFAGRLYGVSKPAERAEELLSEEGLEEWAERPARALSRGLAQRVAIARALVHRPRLLLLDEPFTGLDRRAGQRLGARLDRLRSGGRGLVLVTHETARAAELADSVLVLSRGRVLRQAAAPTAAAALEEWVAEAGDAA